MYVLVIRRLFLLFLDNWLYRYYGMCLTLELWSDWKWLKLSEQWSNRYTLWISIRRLKYKSAGIIPERDLSITRIWFKFTCLCRIIKQLHFSRTRMSKNGWVVFGVDKWTSDYGLWSELTNCICFLFHERDMQVQPRSNTWIYNMIIRISTFSNVWVLQ